MQCDEHEIWMIPKKERPLMKNVPDESVPVVWTSWGWLEGDFGEDGVFHYECEMKEWKGTI